MLPTFTESVSVMQEVAMARSRMGKILDSDAMYEACLEEERDEEAAAAAKKQPEGTQSPSTPTSSRGEGSASPKRLSVMRPTRCSLLKQRNSTTSESPEPTRPVVSRERHEHAVNTMLSWHAKGAMDLSKKTRHEIFRRDRVHAYTNSAQRDPHAPIGSKHKFCVLKKLVQPVGDDEEGIENMLEIPDQPFTVRPDWAIVSGEDISVSEHAKDVEAVFRPDYSDEPCHYLNNPKPRPPGQISEERYEKLAKATAAWKGKTREPAEQTNLGATTLTAR